VVVGGVDEGSVHIPEYGTCESLTCGIHSRLGELLQTPLSTPSILVAIQPKLLTSFACGLLADFFQPEAFRVNDGHQLIPGVDK
jgi:hypothetical protein